MDADLYQRRFRAIFEQSSVPTQLYDSNGHILDVNGAWLKWTRLNEEAVAGLQAAKYCLLNDPTLIGTGVADFFKSALKGEAVQTPAIYYNLADSGLHDQAMWIQANFYPIPGGDGSIREVLILHHDVTELINSKKEAERALEQAKEIAMHAPVGIQIYDVSGTCLFVNTRFISIFGAPPPPGYSVLNDELVRAAGHLHLIHQAFAGTPTVLPLLWYDPAQLQELGEEDREYTRKYGKKCAIETHAIPIWGSDKKVSHVMFVFKDVTGELFMKQEREDALKERDDAKVMIESVLNETKAVIYIKDPHGRILFVNGQFCRILDKSADQILGKFDYELFPKEIAEGFRANDLQVQNARNHVESEEVVIHADGSSHTYLSLKFPIYDSQGALTGVCGLSTDITQRRKLERELGTAKRLESVGLLAGGIAHDFSNMIEIILLAADSLVLTGAGEKTEWRVLIGAMKSAAQSATLLTRQLLAFGRRQTFRTRIIDPGEFVSEAKDILRPALGADILFSAELGTPLWPIQADPLQIEQIVTNLCFNARDAMPKGGRLQLSLRNAILSGAEAPWRMGRPTGDFVALTVHDDGAGITPEVLERIFEPFFSTKANRAGSGLGLSTVYGMVQNMGGDIAVESEQGQGTKMTVVFPRSSEPLSLAAPTPGSRPAIGGAETILLVEDTELLRKVTAQILTECGYTVIEAADAKSGLAIWESRKKKIDMVLSDVVMPGGSGLEMLKKMSSENGDSEVPALLVSAYSEERLSDYDFDHDRFCFLEKPYTANDLLTKIRETLSLSKK